MASHLLIKDFLEKHVLVRLLERGLNLFFDDFHQGIISIFDDEVHAGVVVRVFAVFWVVRQGLNLRVVTDFGKEQDLEDMSESEGPVEEKLEKKATQEVNNKL